MLYALHEAAYYAGSPARFAARATRDIWHSPLNPIGNTNIGRRVYAAADLYANVTRRYGKPDWGIDKVHINGVDVRVRPTTAQSVPSLPTAYRPHHQY